MTVFGDSTAGVNMVSIVYMLTGRKRLLAQGNLTIGCKKCINGYDGCGGVRLTTAVFDGLKRGILFPSNR